MGCAGGCLLRLDQRWLWGGEVCVAPIGVGVVCVGGVRCCCCGCCCCCGGCCWFWRRLTWAGVRVDGGGVWCGGGIWLEVGRPALHVDARQVGLRGSAWWSPHWWQVQVVLDGALGAR